MSFIRLLVLVTPDVNSQLNLERKLTARQSLVARQWFTHSPGVWAVIVFVTAVFRYLFLYRKKFVDLVTKKNSERLTRRLLCE